MNSDQITKGASQMSEATSGLSNLIMNITNYFQSLGLLEILILISILGTAIFLWILIKQDSKRKY